MNKILKKIYAYSIRSLKVLVVNRTFPLFNGAGRI